MTLFLDTNALIKLYHNEAGTDNLIKFIEKKANHLILIISDLSKIEFHSTFLRRARTSEIKHMILTKIFEAFENDCSQFHVVEIEKNIKNFAITLLDNIGRQKGLRTLDAIQLSAAMITNQIIPIDYFVCSDKKLVNIARDFFTIFNPQDNI